MNIAHLFLLQSELDAHIEEQHPRLEGESRHDKKVLALLQELGELAQEARFFKFWSHDQEPRKERMLEEYVDSVHFLLSIGLENGIEEVTINPYKKHTLTEQFLGLYSVFSLMYVYFTPKAYSEAWSAYVGLAEMLGLSWDDVEEAYIQKNEKNHARQDGGY